MQNSRKLIVLPVMVSYDLPLGYLWLLCGGLVHSYRHLRAVDRRVALEVRDRVGTGGGIIYDIPL